MLRGVVFDTSVWLNLLGTGRMRDVLQALPARKVAVCAVSREVLRHPLEPRLRDHPLKQYIDAGLLEQVTLHGDAAELSVELSMAAPPDGLDHGEAATIALAVHLGLTAAIDERKARRIASERFPSLQVVSTVDVLRNVEVANAIGEGMPEAIFSALKHARMRVPPEHDHWVRFLIGPQRASQCPSLKRRNASNLC